MNGHQEVTYRLDFGIRGQRKITAKMVPQGAEAAACPLPRAARLLALAIRLDGLIREKKLADYAEIARRGNITRARMTQIMKLLDLAPDIQEQILFLPAAAGLNERNLRPIMKPVDWNEQRRLFQQFMNSRQKP